MVVFEIVCLPPEDVLPNRYRLPGRSHNFLPAFCLSVDAMLLAQQHVNYESSLKRSYRTAKDLAVVFQEPHVDRKGAEW